jgi:hypothetical protein
VLTLGRLSILTALPVRLSFLFLTDATAVPFTCPPSLLCLRLASAPIFLIDGAFVAVAVGVNSRAPSLCTIWGSLCQPVPATRSSASDMHQKPSLSPMVL